MTVLEYDALVGIATDILREQLAEVCPYMDSTVLGQLCTDAQLCMHDRTERYYRMYCGGKGSPFEEDEQA